MNKQQTKAFTLVELIVVITILAILGTIAFISLQWYSRDSRDSVRIADVSAMKTSLELFHLDAGKYPLPDDADEVTFSGWVLWYQGTFWEQVRKNVSRNMAEVPTDPLIDKEYIYSVLNNRNELEILTLLEWDVTSMNETQVYAWNLEVTPRVDGNYNGLYVKTSDYIVPVPSILTAEDTTGWLELDANNIASQITHLGENIPVIWNAKSNTWALTGLQLSVYTGSITADSTDEEKIAAMTAIQNAYSWSSLKNEWIIKYVLNQSETWALVSLVDTVILWSADAVTTNSSSSSSSTSSSWGESANIVANGWTLTQEWWYNIHTFTSVWADTFTVTSAWDGAQIELLVVAWGWWGWEWWISWHGGWGAGGLIYMTGFTVTAQTYNLSVWSGWWGETQGGNSSFDSLIAIGWWAWDGWVGWSGWGWIWYGTAGAVYQVWWTSTVWQWNDGWDGIWTAWGWGWWWAWAVWEDGSNTLTIPWNGWDWLYFSQFANVGWSPAGWFAGWGGWVAWNNAVQWTGWQGGWWTASAWGCPWSDMHAVVNTWWGGWAWIAHSTCSTWWNGWSGIIIIRYPTPSESWWGSWLDIATACSWASSWDLVYESTNSSDATGLTCDHDIAVCAWSGTGYILESCNLWATAVGTQDTDSNSFWYYFQWWNNAGMTSSTTTSGTQPDPTWYGPGNYYSNATFIVGFNSWANPIWVNNLWWDLWTDGIGVWDGTDVDRQGPCPSWYHVPRVSEWDAVIALWWWASPWNQISNDLKLPRWGYRKSADGTMDVFNGLYWTSTPNWDYKAHYLSFNGTTSLLTWNYNRGNGYSVRCFKNY